MDLSMDLVALADFDAVARHGGFGAASRATGQPKASLSRRVRALETQLGVRLIERGGRMLRLTEEGQALHGRSAALLSELKAVGEEIADTSAAPRGRLRVSVPALHGGAPFGEMAARFVLAHPEVQLEIVAEDRYADPVADGYDIVVRANPAPDSRLVGHLLRADIYVVAAHPSLAVPAQEGASVPAVVQAQTADGATWTLTRADGSLTIRPRPVLRVSSIGLVLGALRGAAGIGLVPRRLVAQDVAAGRLLEWGSLPDRRVEVWALHPSRRLVSAKVKLFLAALREMFQSSGV